MYIIVPMHSCFDSNQYTPPLPLKLSEKVNFTEHVRPIKLARRGDHLPQRCIVSGWGYSDNNDDMASELREVNVTLVNLTLSAELHGYFSLGGNGPSHVSDKIIIHMFFIFYLYLPTCRQVKSGPNSKQRCAIIFQFFFRIC